MKNNFPLYYQTFGNPKHPAVVLIMGISAQLIHWPQKLIDGFVNNGFYVVIFDNRDAGLSKYYDHLLMPDLATIINAKQQGERLDPPYTLLDMTDDVVMLIKELKLKNAHILGFSMGGMIAQLMALEYREYVNSLICVATTSGDPSLPPAKPEVMAYFLSPDRGTEDLTTYVEHKMQLHRLYNHPDYIDEIENRKFYVKVYQRANYPAGFVRQLLAIVSAESRVERLKKLKIPALVIHGDYDPVFPLEHGQQLAQCIPHSHLEVIHNMGHGLPEAFCNQIVSSILKHINNK